MALAVRQPVRDVLTPKVRAARRSGPKLKRFFWGARRFVGWGLPIGWLAASLAAGTAAVLDGRTLQSSRDLPSLLCAMRRGEWPRRIVNDFGREISRCDNGASVVES